MGSEDGLFLRGATRLTVDRGLVGLLGLGPEAPEPDAFWLIESGRALLLAESIANREALLEAHLPEELGLREASSRAELDGLRAEWLRLRAAHPVDAGALAALDARLEAARAARRDVVARVQREARRAGELVYPRPVELAELRARLPAGAALVLYHLLPERALALVVHRGGQRLHDLGPSGEVLAAARAWRAFVSTPEAPDGATAARAYAALVAPLEAGLAAHEHLIVAPDGVLTFLPFEALVLPDGRRLLERWRVSYVPSATVYVSLREAALAHGPARGLLAVADPVYAAETPPAELALRGAGGLRRLPATAEEALGIAALFPEGEARVLLRGRATRGSLEAALDATEGRLAALHLACHGLVDEERPELSGLVLSGGEILGLDALHRREVPAALAVLSACDTARGPLERGEGVWGLVRGFFAAGTPSVVVADWRVPDGSTRELMLAFYRHLVAGDLPPAEALRRAKLELLRRGGAEAHPHHWAGFVLWGL